MAEINETQNNNLQEKIDALNVQIKHLESVIEKNAESAKSISEQIAKNKDEEKAIFSKYEDTIKKVFGENYQKTTNAERIGDLTDIAKSIRKDIKANAVSSSTKELEKKLNELLKDIETIRSLRSKTRQLNSEKKSADNTINESNSELTRFREALRSITVSNNNHLASIDKSNQSIDKTSTNIDRNVEKIDTVISKLTDIYNAMPDRVENDTPSDDEDEGGKKRVKIERDKDDDYEERLESLEKEAEIVDDLKQDFKELIDIIDSKNESLEDENDLLDAEEDKLEGAVSKFKQMHDTADDVNHKLEDGQKTLSKAQATMTKSGGGGSSIWTALSDIFSTIYDFTLAINDKWNEIDDKAHKYGRTIGMNAQQMRNYQKMLMGNDMVNMMNGYSMTQEDLVKLQEGFTDASNSAKILSKNEMEAMAATSKFVGADTSVAIAENMRELGGSLLTSQTYLATTMERAKASGLNMAKHSKNFADNIKLASKYNFKNGLNDISKMTALTDRWKVNLGTFAEGLSKSFGSIEDSISTAASLQVLGGSTAAMFGNPLEMMNMAQTDMAGLIERFQDSIKDAAEWDEKQGVYQLNSFQKRLWQEKAQRLGLNYDDLINAINAEGKARDIDNKMGSRLNGMDDTKKEWLYNNAERGRNGNFYVTYLDSNGIQRQQDISGINASNIDKFRATTVGEEQLQGDVHAIREHLLGTERNGKNKDNSSYIEQRDSLKDAFQTRMAGFLDPLEQEKVGIMGNIKDNFSKIIEKAEGVFNFFKDLDLAGKWNTVIGSLQNIVKFFGGDGNVLDALKLNGDAVSKTNMAIGAGGLFATMGAGFYALKKGVSKLFKGVFYDAPNKIRGGKESVGGTSNAVTTASTASASSAGATPTNRIKSDAELKLENQIANKDKQIKKEEERIRRGKGSSTRLRHLKAEKEGLKNSLRHEQKVATQSIERNLGKTASATPKKGFLSKLFKGKNKPKLKGKGGLLLKAALIGGGLLMSQSANAEEAPQLGLPQDDEGNGVSSSARLLTPSVAQNVNVPLYEPTQERSEIGDLAEGILDYSAKMAVYKKLGTSKVAQNAVSKFTPKALKNLAMKGAKGGGIMGGVGIAADLVNMGGQSFGLWDEGGGMDKTLQITSRTGQYAAIGSMIPGIGTAIGAGVGLLYGVAEQFEGDMNNFADEQLENGNFIVGAGTKVMGIVLKTIKNTFDTVENVVGDVVGGIYDGFVDGGKQILEGDVVGGIGTMLKEGAKGIISAAGDLVKGVWNGITGIAGGAVSSDTIVEQKAKSLWDKATSWFADGGVVRAADGLSSVPSFASLKGFGGPSGTDTVPAWLTPGEMILNKHQQDNLWGIINKSLPYSSPTSINPNVQKPNNTVNNAPRISFEPLTINLTGTLRIDTGNGSSGNITAKDLLNNSNFIREIAELIERNSHGMFNGGTYNGEHSMYKTSKI